MHDPRGRRQPVEFRIDLARSIVRGAAESLEDDY
jgi:hypothetical protein